MITNEQARIYAQLSHAAHGGTTPAGYQIAKDARGNPITFDDPETGFQAKILKKTGTGDHFVVFTGSQNGQDWAANTALGTPQWSNKNKTVVFAAIAALTDISSLTFTGYSLGGGLAQYATYDYAALGTPRFPISLVTFNGLGGLDGLKQLHGGSIDASIAAQVNATHFYANSSGQTDVVSRLGGGHFGGSTYQINAAPSLGLVDIHNAWSAFEKLTIPATPTAIQHLNIPWAQRIAASFAYLGDNGTIDDVEGWTRAAGGVLEAAAGAPAQEINQIAEALLPGAATQNIGALRDGSPPLRLAIALSGFGVLGIANVTQLISRANEVSIGVAYVANHIAHAAYDFAVKSGSSAVTALNGIYKEATGNVLRIVSDYLNTQPTTTTPRNATIFDLSVDPANLKPNAAAGLGASSGGNGLLQVGAGWQATMPSEFVNGSGMRNAASSALATDFIRPGNHNLSDVTAQMNALRATSAQPLPTLDAQITYAAPIGSASSAHQTVTFNGAMSFAATVYYDATGNALYLTPDRGQNVTVSLYGGGSVTLDGSQDLILGANRILANGAWRAYGASVMDRQQTGVALTIVAAQHNTPYTDPLTLDGSNDGVRLSALPVNLTNADAPLNLFSLDDNADKKLDSNDAAYRRLQLWDDRNQDGYASREERQSLRDIGITSIDLAANDERWRIPVCR